MTFSSGIQKALKQFEDIIIGSLGEIGSDRSPSSGIIGIKWEDDFNKFYSKLFELGFRSVGKEETMLNGDDVKREYYKFRAGMHNYIQVYIGSNGSDVLEITFILDHLDTGGYYHEDYCNTIEHIWQAIHNKCGRCGNIDTHGFEIWALKNVKVLIKQAEGTHITNIHKDDSAKSIIKFINMRADSQKTSQTPAQVADDDEVVLEKKKCNVSKERVDPQLRGEASVPTDNTELASLRREVAELRELIIALTAKIGTAEDNITSAVRNKYDVLKNDERTHEYSAPHEEGNHYL